jgi:hypothetical protein
MRMNIINSNRTSPTAELAGHQHVHQYHFSSQRYLPK